MKKTTCIFIFFILLSSVFVSQTPSYFNTNSVANGNSIPLGSGGTALTSRKAQWFIPSNSLGGVPPVCSITVVYFQASTSATVSYPILNLKLKTGTGTGLTGSLSGPIEPGMTTVYSAVNRTIATTVGSWISFSLTTPFSYDPTLPLIVELEHNATSFTPSVLGPYLCQAVNIPGPGNGRQWANYNATTLTNVGAQQVNFGIDVITVPCSSAPSSNTILPLSYSTCPSLINPNLTLAASYTVGDITYQWQSSSSSGGPFISIPGATMSTAPVGNLTASKWFQVVATCANTGGGATTITPTGYIVGPSVVSTVPYYESFEGILDADRLPNCSWFAGNLGSSVRTYTSSQSNNRLPRSGNNFATFGLPSTNNSVYSNGIQMSSGITYSAALWYATEYMGYNNWTSLSILVGPNQSNSGLVQIASIGPAISGSYNLLSGTFTVPSSGQYYIAIKATSSSGSALYLSWDDLSVTIPCYAQGSVNSPTLNLSSSNTTICSGSVASLTASGANTFTWSTGASGGSISEILFSSKTYTVSGTNTLTGCTSQSSQFINVDPSPTVYIFASSPAICFGQSVNITALGADSYLWSNGYTTSIINVSPSVTTTYTITGTSLNGCTTVGQQTITVNTLPVITVSSGQTVVCYGDTITLNASGADSYTWSTGASSISISDILFASQTYSVSGTNTLTGCTNQATQFIKVNPLPSVLVFANSPTICLGQSVNITALGASSYSWSNGYATSIINVSPSITTTYTVIGKNLNGCASLTEQTITVIPLPIISASGNQTAGCVGDPIILGGTGALAYQWLSGSTGVLSQGNPINIVLTGSTTYSIYGKDANGCVGEATLQISVNPTPTISVSSSIASPCVGEQVVLTASGANGSNYLWQYGSTSNTLQGASITIIANTSGIYTVTGTDTHNCFGTSQYVQFVQECTANTEIIGKNNAPRLYPNPTSGSFIVDLGNNSLYNTELYDLTGRMILNTEFTDHKTELNISNLSNGIYYLKIKNENHIEIIKVIKQ